LGKSERPSAEAQRHDFSSGQKADCGGRMCTPGKVHGCEEEGGLGRAQRFGQPAAPSTRQARR